MGATIYDNFLEGLFHSIQNKDQNMLETSATHRLCHSERSEESAFLHEARSRFLGLGLGMTIF